MRGGDYVKIKQHNMHVYRIGDEDKPKLLLMSGSGTVAPVYDFKVLYEKLAEDFRIIVIEKFGYGYSDIFEAPCDIDSLVSMQKEALDRLGESGPYILAPHSMSGLEAIRWEQKYPEDVQAIVGLDMALPDVYQGWTEGELSKRIRFMELAGKVKLQKLQNLFEKRPRWLSQEEADEQKRLRSRNAFNVCYVNEANAVLKNADMVADAGNIECPMLLFVSNGKQVSRGWIEYQQQFATKMNAKMVCFDCGHYIHYYKSEEMAAEMKDFITKLN